YRDGRDAMGWHSDDEPELGPEPLIASLSLGAVRRFVLRRRDDPARKLALELGPGSLLLMGGSTQRYWKHALPRTARPVGARINLTFRQIAARPSPRDSGRGAPLRIGLAFGQGPAGDLATEPGQGLVEGGGDAGGAGGRSGLRAGEAAAGDHALVDVVHQLGGHLDDRDRAFAATVV